jgi:hypothetical protein
LVLSGLLSRRWLRAGVCIFLIAAGAAGSIFAVFSYFASHNALSALLEAAFGYSLAYSAQNYRGLFGTALAGLSYLPISILAVSAWLTGIFHALFARYQLGDADPLLYVALVALPIELVFSSISGRAFIHYYIAWLPTMAVLVSFLAHALIRNSTHYPIGNAWKINSGYIWVVALLLSLGLMSSKTLLDFRGRDYRNQMTAYHAVILETVEYIRNSTSEDDYILVWGAETTVYYLAERESPTRFLYQYPLYVQYGYQSEELIEEFMHDLATHNPVLIIDTAGMNNNVIPIDAELRQQRELSDEQLDGVFEHFASHYQLVETIDVEQGQWHIYQHID